ncbi:DUF1273 domain-containing protein [Paenibacillus puerhi]|uniref:DUF1273 domain-containing protein n=1 Tax=Paenibacillus puerhi TaxID=2692622 RepID=UPI001357A450|nr:DUF1273 domain-containing protein [Paenibacillus puerhi]
MKRLIISGYKASEIGIFSNKNIAVTYIQKAIEKKLIPLIEEGLEWVIITGQWGVELWAGEVVLKLKSDYPDVKLAVITPFLSIQEKWNEEKQEYFNRIIKQADFVDSASKEVYRGPWQFTQLNTFLIRNSDGMLLLFDEEAHPDSSPRYMKQLAQAKAIQSDYYLHCMNMYDLQMVVEEAAMDQEHSYEQEPES